MENIISSWWGMEKLKSCAEKHMRKPEVSIVGVDLEGITQSEGLIFKAQFLVHNPYSYAMPKWKSADYTLTCRNRLVTFIWDFYFFMASCNYYI